MKTSLIFLISIALAGYGCERSSSENTTPECLANKIEQFKAIACDSAATVNEFKFQGKTVYVFNPGACGADMTTPVYDSGCNEIGELGGIAGNTKINGEEFSSAIFIRTLWEN